MTIVGRCSHGQFANEGLFNDDINSDWTAFCARTAFNSINCNLKYNNSYKFKVGTTGCSQCFGPTWAFFRLSSMLPNVCCCDFQEKESF